MDYEKMILMENTDIYYEAWSGYRKKLTEYILENAGAKKAIAIWGAGGCNDIDIDLLSRENKITLIDHDVEKCKNAVEKSGLYGRDIEYVDLRFWDIDYEWYKIFEAMLQEKMNVEYLVGHMRDAVKRMEKMDYRYIVPFDISVAIGIASQLNSRIAGLFFIYKDNYDDSERKIIINEINMMNELATAKMASTIETLTKEKLLIGLEANENDVPESIAGNKEILNYLSDKYNLDKSDYVFEWPFTEFKKYNMNLWLINLRK